MTVDEHWAEERVEELNLKSYDRSHIEELKSRFGGCLGRQTLSHANRGRLRRRIVVAQYQFN